MKKYSIIILLGLLFLSCQKNNNNSIESIKVLYYNSIFDTVTAVNCDDIKYSPPKNDTLDHEDLFVDYLGVPDTIITDKKILQKIEIVLKQYQLIENDNIDARMKCYITYANKKIDSLCIDQNPIYAIYNNEPVKLSNEFIYLIRKYCGFYEWMGIDHMIYFDELNDLSFTREKVKSRSGEEY